TPLASILGAGTELVRDGERLDEPVRAELARAIVEEAEHLNLIVTNLLGVTRLEAGSIELHRRPEAIEEIMGAALERLKGRLGDRKVHTEVPEQIPMVPADPILLEQVFANLLENAIRYSPEG